jgi:hypothetical protein
MSTPVSRHLVRAVYLVTTLVVGPLVAYWVAVAGIRYGLDWRGFALVLLGLPAALAVLAAGLLRVGKRGAAVGVAGAVTATISLVVALVFVYLAAR